MVCFPGFADLSTPKGNFVQSGKFISLGTEWCVRMYPRGDKGDNTVSILLELCSSSKSQVEFSFAIQGLTRQQEIREFNPTAPSFDRASRDEILACLVDGALLVTVNLRHVKPPLPFFPDNPATCKIVQSMFMNEEFADIIFEVGGEQLQSPSLFHAHRLILKKAAPQLEEICVASDQAPTRVQILDVSPDTFKALLLYIYGFQIPNLGKEISCTKEIMETADKYGVTNLKLEAEAHYVYSVRFNLENIVENLRLAESRNCALLKERVMKFLVNNATEIVQKQTLKDFPGGRLNDSLTALAIKEKEKMTTRHCEKGPPSPSTIDQDWETNMVCFPGFADLSTQKGLKVQSSKFVSLGREWCVWIYPRGDGATPDETTFSLFLMKCSPGRVKVEYTVAIQALTKRPDIQNEFTDALSGCGWKNFYTRNEILNHLVDGALMVEVKMRHVKPPLPLVPDNPAMCKVVQNMFMNEEFADIIFEVGGEQLQSPSLFHAHRLILKKAAPQLEEICVASDQAPTRVQILDVSPDTFKALLLYIYGFQIPNLGKEISCTKEIMETADKYGVTNLKLEAEAHYVYSVRFNLENIVENLRLAESRNCALLKERVMKFLVNNATEIVQKQTLKDFPGGRLNDSLTALAIKEKEKMTTRHDRNEPMSTLPICELRRRAYEKGVDVDGTREMLLSALDQDQDRRKRCKL